MKAFDHKRPLERINQMHHKQNRFTALLWAAIFLAPMILPNLIMADSKVLPHHNMLRDDIDIEAGIWGRVRRYTGRSITLESGKTYHFGKNVLVDMETSEPNARGNVRIFINDAGKAHTVFFHGISMPEMFQRYGN